MGPGFDNASESLHILEMSQEILDNWHSDSDESWPTSTFSIDGSLEASLLEHRLSVGEGLRNAHQDAGRDIVENYLDTHDEIDDPYWAKKAAQYEARNVSRPGLRWKGAALEERATNIVDAVEEQEENRLYDAEQSIKSAVEDNNRYMFRSHNLSVEDAVQKWGRGDPLEAAGYLARRSQIAKSYEPRVGEGLNSTRMHSLVEALVTDLHSTMETGGTEAVRTRQRVISDIEGIDARIDELDSQRNIAEDFYQRSGHGKHSTAIDGTDIEGEEIEENYRYVIDLTRQLKNVRSVLSEALNETSTTWEGSKERAEFAELEGKGAADPTAELRNLVKRHDELEKRKERLTDLYQRTALGTETVVYEREQIHGPEVEKELVEVTKEYNAMTKQIAELRKSSNNGD